MFEKTGLVYVYNQNFTFFSILWYAKHFIRYQNGKSILEVTKISNWKNLFDILKASDKFFQFVKKNLFFPKIG